MAVDNRGAICVRLVTGGRLRRVGMGILGAATIITQPIRSEKTSLQRNSRGALHWSCGGVLMMLGCGLHLVRFAPSGSKVCVGALVLRPSRLVTASIPSLNGHN